MERVGRVEWSWLELMHCIMEQVGGEYRSLVGLDGGSSF
jgi:hypothetical protein